MPASRWELLRSRWELPYIPRVLSGRSRGGRLTILVLLCLLALGVSSGPVAGSAVSPPKIAITRPSDGAVVHSSTVKVAGKFTVAPFDGPSPHVSGTLNGNKLHIGVDGATKYDFEGNASLKKGTNELTVAVNDGDGGESSATVSVKYEPILPTRSQCVDDKRGDSSDHLTHMDIVRACARRRGAKVVFKITTAKPPPNIHDGSGNPAAPCFEVPRTSGGPGPAPLQSCGDAKLRGYTQRFWPTVPFSISGRTSTWKVPLKYLPKRSFRWRAYLGEGYRYADKAPQKGFLTFVVKPPA